MKYYRSCLALLVVWGWIPLMGAAAAGERSSEQQACSTKTSGDWTICESANFRFCCRGSSTASHETVLKAERLKHRLAEKWLAEEFDAEARWTPKCDIILHASLASYLRAVPGGDQTVGSSLIETDRGRIITRRIDIRADRPGWFSAALGHELTHVVLADAFPGSQVPHWADEGMAVMADPTSKQDAHFEDLRYAQMSRSTLRLVELLALEGYPQPHQQAAFYGQSASVVRYLVERDSAARFLNFVRVAEEQGYEQALRSEYQISGIRDLESRWVRYVQTNSTRDALVSLD